MAQEEAKVSQSKDPCTYSNFHQLKLVHMHLEWKVNFEKKELDGYCEVTIEKKESGVTELILDTKSLKIGDWSVQTNKHINKSKQKKKKKASIRSGKVEAFGEALHIELPKEWCKTSNKGLKVRIAYKTSPEANGIQWLEPSQTAGGKHPYLFTQFQPILARTAFPCFDTPGVKSTYTANVTCEKGLVALMSGLADKSDRSHTDDKWVSYSFRQPVPICSYLVALVVGNLERRQISPRCDVWCEPSIVDKAAFEFANMEKFLSIAESICGKYHWSRYDLLCLPPSFPCSFM
ncbi:leukotriene A-4 hydrolase, partial [Reticulomyxa filosa]